MPFYSRVPYTADGTTQVFGVTFPFINRSDVSVTVNGSAATFTWQNDATITISTPTVVNNDVVRIIRRTQIDAVAVDWVDGSGMSEADLDTNTLQLFYLAQEAIDDASERLSLALDGSGNWDTLSKQFVNTPAPTQNDHVATKAYVDAKTNLQMNHYATSSGTVDAYALTTGDSLTSVAEGTGFIFKSLGANTGAVTINIDGIGAVALKKKGGAALTGGELPAVGGMIEVINDGTDYELKSPDGETSREVAFLAEVNSSQNISSGSDTTISFDNEVFDIGGDYDDTTYKFTAPFAGRYHFDVRLTTTGATSVATDDIFEGHLLVGGVEYPHTYICPLGPAAQGFHFSVDVSMTAGQTAEVRMNRVSGSGTWKTHNSQANACTFSGHLIK